MTLTNSVLQLTAHPLLLRFVLVVLAVAFFAALNAIAKRLFESHRLFGNGREGGAFAEKSRSVVYVPYFW